MAKGGYGTPTRKMKMMGGGAMMKKKKAMAKTVDESWDAAQDEGFDLSRLIDGGDPFKESE